MMTLLKILELLVEQQLDLPRLVARYPHYFTRTTNIALATQAVEAAIDGLSRHFATAQPQPYGSEGQALKLRWNDGAFIWLRVSKTEKNLLRLLVDSPSKKRTDDLFTRASRWLQEWVLTTAAQ